MKTPIALAIFSSLTALAAGPFVIDKADPEAAVKRRAAAVAWASKRSPRNLKAHPVP
jgi:hypothetical protein